MLYRIYSICISSSCHICEVTIRVFGKESRSYDVIRHPSRQRTQNRSSTSQSSSDRTKLLRREIQVIESIPKGEIGAGSRLPGQQTDFSLRIPFPSPVSRQAFRGFGLARCDTSILVLGGNACASTRTTKLVGFRPVESYINLT
jgi:hypothetical protein